MQVKINLMTISLRHWRKTSLPFWLLWMPVPHSCLVQWHRSRRQDCPQHSLRSQIVPKIEIFLDICEHRFILNFLTSICSGESYRISYLVITFTCLKYSSGWFDAKETPRCAAPVPVLYKYFFSLITVSRPPIGHCPHNTVLWLVRPLHH